ncbi:MAG TPA: efflux RND transporter periplasmic adaptor subunit [Candidatus Bathyarchaeia archaeon]|nr:efflux RND transporter periplasmic adaptor subunit [Candidatus Bathyarchaeia archaeon]
MKSIKRNYVAISIALLVAIGTFLAVHLSKTSAVSGTEYFEVGRGTVKNVVSADVSLDSAESADLAFENGGKIKDIFVSVGDQVRAGQLLAEEDSEESAVSLRQAQAARDAAAAQLKQAQEDVNIQKNKLRSLKNGSGKEYEIKTQKSTEDKSKIGVDVQSSLLAASKDAVEKANLQLAKTRLTAPIDGVITDRSIEVGEVVAPANPVMKIAGGENLEADAFVSELDVKKISVGMPAEISISSDDGNDIDLQAEVKDIYPSETDQNGAAAYKVVLMLASQDADLRPGMTGTVNIKISQQSQAMVIPQNSLFSDAGKKYVMMMSEGFPERREVQTGAYGSDGMAEILSGLSVGDKIIKF